MTNVILTVKAKLFQQFVKTNMVTDVKCTLRSINIWILKIYDFFFYCLTEYIRVESK